MLEDLLVKEDSVVLLQYAEGKKSLELDYRTDGDLFFFVEPIWWFYNKDIQYEVDAT